MKRLIYIMLLALLSVNAAGQIDKRDVRRGNRDYKKENYKDAEIEYRKAIVKDSLSVAANYNLATDLYRQNNSQEAQKVLDRIKEVAPASENASDYYYNLGDIAIANQDWQTAVTAFEESLLRNPADLDAKENYIYAKKKLQQQQQQQNQQNNQNQNNQDNQNDQNQDQNQQNNDQNQDDKKDQDQQNDQNQNNDQNDQDQQQGQQPKITPQAAQQMLQAIQAKEKETQEKVKKEKAKALQSRQKDRNW
ncbi:MAG: tetratricopeptide repeat protein [Bacteroidales bacterium]|nr:tetratricopeptide repeat protein [Bacteroidales bacterium]